MYARSVKIKKTDRIKNRIKNYKDRQFLCVDSIEQAVQHVKKNRFIKNL
jgi:hypothetical protein